MPRTSRQIIYSTEFELVNANVSLENLVISACPWICSDQYGTNNVDHTSRMHHIVIVEGLDFVHLASSVRHG